MIGPLNQVSSHWLATGRALFKAPISERLPGAFADLLFDPAERYAQLWAQAMDGSREPQFEEGASEPAHGTGASEWLGDARPDRFIRAAKPSHRSIRTNRPPAGKASPSHWEFAERSEQRVVEDESPQMTEGAQRILRRDTPFLDRLSHRAPLATRPEDLGSTSAVEAGTGQSDRSMPSMHASEEVGSRATWQHAAGQHDDGGRKGILKAEELRDSAGNGTSLTPQVESRSRTSPAPVRMAKSFSDIGRILGANLPRERSGQLLAPEATRPDDRRLISFPVPPRSSAKGPDNVAPRLAADHDLDRAPAVQPTPDLEAIFEELEERFRLEYLRMYGTSGGF
jgi:hypothetical protein